jgi:hypothetical protein
MAGKVIRCECGVLFDTDEHSTCPSCGTPPRAGPATGEPSGESAAGAAGPAVPSRAQRPWLIYAGAAAIVILVVAFGVRALLDAGGGSAPVETQGERGGPGIVTQQESDTDQGERPPVQDSSTEQPSQTTVQQDAAQQHQQQSQQTAVLPTPSPPQPPPSNGLVDPALVGAWSLDFPGGQGMQHWVMEIRADGTYSFTSTGGGPMIKHAGSFKALHGAWSLKSTTINWEDGGTYQLPDPNTFHMLGKLGLGVWTRVKG